MTILATTRTTATSATSSPGRPGIPFGRLVIVELRKMLDTRAGRWLLITIGVVTLAVVVILFRVGNPQDLTMANFLLGTAFPQALLLPLLGVMAVTSEWGQRTALITFTLEPRRLRVVVAKLLAALVLGVVALLFAYAAAAAATGLGVVFRDGAGTWSIGAGSVGGVVLSQLLGVVQGVGFGLLFANTAVAIVAYLVLPTAWLILGSLITSLDTAAQWLDMTRTGDALTTGQMTGTLWAHLATSTAVWVALPVVVGTWLVLRRDVT